VSGHSHLQGTHHGTQGATTHHHPHRLLAIIVIGGAVFCSTRSDKQKDQLIVQAQIQATQKKVAMYKAFPRDRRDQKTRKPTKPKYEGYDAFDYNKETEYKPRSTSRSADLARRSRGD
jgi:hypothetical protein